MSRNNNFGRNIIDNRQLKTLVHRGFLFVLIISVFGQTDVVAVKPQIWRDISQQAFEKGQPEDVSLTREGTVTLSPEFTQVADTGEGFVWALVADSKGTVYMATGPEGRIFAIKPGGKTPELLFDSPEVAIFSLAIGADGALYAGSSPGGLIYRLAPGKEPVAFCRTGDAHVWAILPRPGGGFYVSTGGVQGRVLKISDKGDVAELYVSKDPNVVSLALGPGGILYAGTDHTGLVYRIEHETQVSVLYDAGEKEIHALVVSAEGMVYAAAMARDNKPNESGSNGNPKKNDKEGSVLYAIRPSGSGIRLWETDDPLLLGLALKLDGSLIVVTGKKPRVYHIWPDGKTTLLLQLKNDVHPWAVFSDAQGSVWMGTSGAGLVYRLGQIFAKKGTLTSEPYDFSLTSHWGRLTWWGEQPQGTAISVQTRSGNNETPDDTWSDWSTPVVVSGAQIDSRPARFLQYRLLLTSEMGKETPLLREIRLAGLQENVPPMVIDLKVGPIGQSDKEAPKGDEETRPKIRTIDWTGGDVNGDDLFYAIYFRGLGESHWRLLKENVTTAHYVWNTEAVPDGTLQVRVVASDGLNNVTVLTGETISTPFLVDNTAPIVRLSGVRTTGSGSAIVDGVLEDASSAIRNAAYALNSNDWHVIFPADAIFDSPTEALSVVIDQLKPGSYTLVVRAYDTAGNVGAGKTIFEIK